MSFIAWFFLTVLFLSVTEVFLLIKAASTLGFLSTFALCILTGIIGGAVVRRQGLQTLARVQRELALGRIPAGDLLDGIALIVLGVLLCMPGFLTDAFGFLMLVPPLRRSVVRWILERAGGQFQVRVWSSREGFRPPDPFGEEREIIDVEFKEKDEPGENPRP